MTEKLKAVAAFAEDLGSIPSSKMVASNDL